MKKIMLIGNAGGGKSTLCSVMCATYELPYYSIDAIQWQPGWKLVGECEFNTAHAEILAGHCWLIDGYGSWDSVLLRMDAADTIVVVDHPIGIHYWWATKRQIKSLFGRYKDEPLGCPLWKVTLRLYKMMWWLHTVQRSELLAECERRSHEKRVIYLNSPSALKVFTDSIKHPSTEKEFPASESLKTPRK